MRADTSSFKWETGRDCESEILNWEESLCLVKEKVIFSFCSSISRFQLNWSYGVPGAISSTKILQPCAILEHSPIFKFLRHSILKYSQRTSEFLYSCRRRITICSGVIPVISLMASSSYFMVRLVWIGTTTKGKAVMSVKSYSTFGRYSQTLI